MFVLDKTLRFKSLHEFEYHVKHEKISSSKKQATNLPCISFLVGGSKYLIMLGDSHLTYTTSPI